MHFADALTAAGALLWLYETVLSKQELARFYEVAYFGGVALMLVRKCMDWGKSKQAHSGLGRVSAFVEMTAHGSRLAVKRRAINGVGVVNRGDSALTLTRGSKKLASERSSLDGPPMECTMANIDLLLQKNAENSLVYNNNFNRLTASFKIPNVDPSHLQSGFVNNMAKELVCQGYIVVGMAVRPGCIELVVQLLNHKFCSKPDMDSAYNDGDDDEDIPAVLEQRNRSVLAELLHSLSVNPGHESVTMAQLDTRGFHVTYNQGVFGSAAWSVEDAPNMPDNALPRPTLERAARLCVVYGEDHGAHGAESKGRTSRGPVSRLARTCLQTAAAGKGPSSAEYGSGGGRLARGFMRLVLFGTRLTEPGNMLIARYRGRCYGVTVIGLAGMVSGGRPKDGDPLQAVEVEVRGLLAHNGGLLLVDCRAPDGWLCGTAPVLLLSQEDADMADELLQLQHQVDALAATAAATGSASKGVPMDAMSAALQPVVDLGMWRDFVAAMLLMKSVEAAEAASYSAEASVNKGLQQHASWVGSRSKDADLQPEPQPPGCDLSNEVQLMYLQPHVQRTLLDIGAQLVVYAVQRGWQHTAQRAMGDFKALGVPVSEVLQLCSTSHPQALGLLHVAVMSGRIEMLDVLEGWAGKLDWASSAPEMGHLTPLHLAARLPDMGALATHILMRYKQARLLWNKVRDVHGTTPAKVAQRAGRAFLNDLAAGFLSKALKTCAGVAANTVTSLKQHAVAAAGSALHIAVVLGANSTRAAAERSAAGCLPAAAAGSAATAAAGPAALGSAVHSSGSPSGRSSRSHSSSGSVSRMGPGSASAAAARAVLQGGFVSADAEAALATLMCRSSWHVATTWLMLSCVMTTMTTVRTIYTGPYINLVPTFFWGLPHIITAYVRMTNAKLYAERREHLWSYCTLGRVLCMLGIGLGLPTLPHLAEFCSKGQDIVADCIIPAICEQTRVRKTLTIRLLDVGVAAMLYMRLGLYSHPLPALLHGAVKSMAWLAVAAALEYRYRATLLKGKAAHISRHL